MNQGIAGSAAPGPCRRELLVLAEIADCYRPTGPTNTTLTKPSGQFSGFASYELVHPRVLLYQLFMKIVLKLFERLGLPALAWNEHRLTVCACSKSLDCLFEFIVVDVVCVQEAVSNLPLV